MKPRVAMLGLRAPWGAEGGVEQAVGALAPRLAERGFSVTVYCRRRYNPHGTGMHRGVQLVDVDTVYSRHLEAFAHTALAAPLASLHHDIVHIHAAGPALLGWVPRLAGRATVVTVHALDWQREKWGRSASAVLRAGAWSAARFPHRVIVVGRHLRRHYRERYGVDATWIPNAVDPISAAPLADAGVPGLTPRGYLMFMGRLVPEKGIERLLEAYRESGVRLPLVMVGGSTHMDGFAERMRQRAPARVVWTGPRYRQEKSALLTNARAVVLPSRLEGFPLVPLEAMAAGRPVLLSDIAPHREILEGAERAGWLVPDGGWSEALRAAAGASDAALEARGAAGSRHVAQRFSWAQAADATAAVYRDVLSEVGVLRTPKLRV